MEQFERKANEPNSNVPAELLRFAFLIGRWQCQAKLKSDEGEWQALPATWLGRFILDGYAIADEFRMMDASGELIVLGMNLRTFETATQTWNIKWLDTLAGTWTDLVSKEASGLDFDGASIVYAFREPTAAHAYTRASYLNISESHFTWRGEKSNDGSVWSEFMVVECGR